MNKDQVKGAIKDAAGKVQQKTGEVIGSDAQQVEGKVQKNYGDAKEVLKDSTRKP